MEKGRNNKKENDDDLKAREYTCAIYGGSKERKGIGREKTHTNALVIFHLRCPRRENKTKGAGHGGRRALPYAAEQYVRLPSCLFFIIFANNKKWLAALCSLPSHAL